MEVGNGQFFFRYLFFLTDSDEGNVIFQSETLNIGINGNEVIIKSSENITVELENVSKDWFARVFIAGGDTQKMLITSIGEYELSIHGGENNGKVLSFFHSE